MKALNVEWTAPSIPTILTNIGVNVKSISNYSKYIKSINWEIQEWNSEPDAIWIKAPRLDWTHYFEQITISAYDKEWNYFQYGISQGIPAYRINVLYAGDTMVSKEAAWVINDITGRTAKIY